MKTRVYEVAKQVNISSQLLIKEAKKLHIELKSHLCMLTQDQTDVIKDYFENNKDLIENKNTKSQLNSSEKNIGYSKTISEEFKKTIQKSFSTLSTLDSFVDLLNSVNKKIYVQHTHYVEKKHLTYYAYASNKKYNTFDIPKKSGGIREIYAPVKGLKYILQTLNIMFQSIHKPQMSSHGFLLNRSVVTNAKLHVDKNYVFNIDLENFFPSIHQARIWKRLQYPPFSLNKELSNLISNLVCFQYEKDSKNKNFLPQGAPTSPILSNIICHRLDKKLFSLAKDYNVKYTRYADDMTFSSDYNVYQDNGEFLQKLFKIISGESFNINSKKTRLQKRGYKQEVTGIIVNEKINVSRRYIKNLRGLIHLVEKFGEKKAQKIFAKKNADKCLEDVIRGKIQYLKMVKGKDDSTYKTLYNKFLNTYKLLTVSSSNEESSEDDIVLVKDKSCNHNPKRLVEILNKFRDGNSPFKAAVHSELYLDSSEDQGYNGDYDLYMDLLKKEYDSISKDLRSLSNRLNGKIYAFLFSSKLGEKKDEKNFYTWGENNMRFGWSSPELKKWCVENNEHNPFIFDQISEKNKANKNNIALDNFLAITNIFKNEIEVRDDNDALLNLLCDIEIWLTKLNKDFKLDFNDQDIIGKTFFTDFHWLSKGLKKIFEGISKRGEYKTIKISMEKIENYLELRIVHMESQSKKDAESLFKEKYLGDFADIKKYFCSICDWSVEAHHLDKNFRIHFLTSNKTDDIEYLDNNVEGFTHILRFYK